MSYLIDFFIGNKTIVLLPIKKKYYSIYLNSGWRGKTQFFDNNSILLQKLLHPNDHKEALLELIKSVYFFEE